jgi:DNA-binding response OmpR family regulator
MTDTILVKRKILCADGHEDTCLLVRYLLKPFGYEVTTVNDLNSGLRIARTTDYDLYLIADKLSEGTGIEFCEKLREFDRQTPLLFWSSRVYERDRQSALDAGANVFLRKPCDYDAIPAIIFQLVDESQRPEVNRLSRTELVERRSAYAVSPSTRV